MIREFYYWGIFDVCDSVDIFGGKFPILSPSNIWDKSMYILMWNSFGLYFFSIIILEILSFLGEGFFPIPIPYLLLKSSDNSHPHFYFNTIVDMHCISDIQREGIGTSLHCCSPSVKLANKCEKKFWKK